MIRSTLRCVVVVALVVPCILCGCDDDGIGGLMGDQVFVASPREGDVLSPGQTYTISWVGVQAGRVFIFYTVDGGNTWFDVTGTGMPIDNYGNYDWTVPAAGSDSCQIRVVPESFMDERHAESEWFSIWLS